ncbi:MAG TPA: hypothetical protein VHP38_15530 [Ruminiclostridium sp.]|nr:hypothetical protein [Ruminiclostridium sp.]
MVTEKIIEGCKVISFTPDLTEDDRKKAEKETVKNILRDYNSLEGKKIAATQK